MYRQDVRIFAVLFANCSKPLQDYSVMLNFHNRGCCLQRNLSLKLQSNYFRRQKPREIYSNKWWVSKFSWDQQVLFPESSSEGFFPPFLSKDNTVTTRNSRTSERLEIFLLCLQGITKNPMRAFFLPTYCYRQTWLFLTGICQQLCICYCNKAISLRLQSLNTEVRNKSTDFGGT